MNKILYLYREIMPYNIPVLRSLVGLGYQIAVVYQDSTRKTPYIPPAIDNIHFLDEAKYDKKSLIEMGFAYQPDLVFVCDWSVHKYNRCGAFLRKKLNIPVVVGCDTQWRGGRQWLNIFTSKIRHHVCFTHVLVAGVRQFEYAKKIGFKNDQIILNLYSADINNFNQSKIEPNRFKERNFLFVGRFIKEKGVKQLLNAWESIDNKKNSTLTMIGDGPLKNKLDFPEDVMVYPFMSQKKLLQFANKSSCFILPSNFEPWALVIQEFAVAGLPLIVTDACGATPHFVINKYNGLTVPAGSSLALKKAIQHMINIPDNELFKYAKRSRNLSKRINPELVANSLVSVL